MIVQRTNAAFEGSARQPARRPRLALPPLLRRVPSHAGLRAVFLVICTSLTLVAPLSSLRADVALYQAAVPLQGQAEADRAAAFGEALKIAAVRASGRKDAGAAPAIAAAASAPTPYVQQYAATADHMLKVGFDGRAIEQLLQQAGLPLWPAERPTTTVYLFLDSVSGASRAVTAAERPAERSELERAAQVRGVPLAWPTETVDAATAASRVAAAGGKGAVLVGAPQGGAWQWTFGHSGQTARAQGAPDAGLGLAADTLASRYAPGSTRSMTTVTVRVGGLADVRAYAALTRYLEGLSLVRTIAVREFAGDTAQFELGCRGDLELLRRIVAIDGRLAPASRPDGAAPETPDFVWQP
jgi:hypothetical protein